MQTCLAGALGSRSEGGGGNEGSKLDGGLILAVVHFDDFARFALVRLSEIWRPEGRRCTLVLRMK